MDATNKVQALRQQFESYEKHTSSSASSAAHKKPLQYNNNGQPPPATPPPTQLPFSLKRRPMILDLHQLGGEEEEEEDGDSTSSGSSTCVNLLNGDNKDQQEAESDLKALTPTSSSSASSSGYGRVKRSNAFRAKDPASPEAPGLKAGVERAKSLEGRERTVLPHRTLSTSDISKGSKAVNVVTPYQVSQIYQPQRGANKDLEYAIPVIARKKEEKGKKGRGGGGLFPPQQPQQQPQLGAMRVPLGQERLSTPPPPEKPPRTFLYDILSERGKVGVNSNNKGNNNKNSELYSNNNNINSNSGNSNSNNMGGKLAPLTPSKLQHSSSTSSSSTLTSANTPYKQPLAGRISVATATVRQTKASRPSLPNPNTQPPNPYQHGQLVRSKTESQLVPLRGNKGVETGGSRDYDYAYVTNTKSACASFYSPPHPHPVGAARGNLNLNPPLLAQQQGRNRFSSNPGIYQAVQHEHGLPPVSSFGYSPTHHLYPAPRPQYPLAHPHETGGARAGSGGRRATLGHPSLSLFQGGGNGRPMQELPDRLCDRDRERSKSELSLVAVGKSAAGVLSANNNNNSGNISSGKEGSSGKVTPGRTGVPRNLNLESSSGNAGTGHQGKKPGIQQSIQNLVNQLFSSNGMKDAGSSTDSGIQLGSESLSSCDTPVGDSTTDTGDSDCENDGDSNTRQVVEARKGYVRRVSSFRVQELGASINRLIQSSKKMHGTEPLFECLLVVGLNRDPYTGLYHAYIRDKFPPNTKLPSGVEQFCFPDSLEWPCHEGSSAQFYTLAITDQRGSRKFGCCYRILPEGANICIPITYCIISNHRAIGFYREVLREITMRHGYSEYQKRFWMEELYKKQFPVTGGSITVTEPLLEDPYGGGGRYAPYHTKAVTIKRRVDHRLDETDLLTLLSALDLTVVIKVFGSLLLERKVVLISRALSTLSLCVEALESMLYPFSWQHTFVPILPLDMTDVLDAPAPFLIGVLRSAQNPWDKTLDEGIVVDLDNNKIISCVGDEGTILPKRIHRKLKDALQLVLNLADQKDSTKNVLISECFIRMFVETMGHHAQHIVVQQDGMKIFERESFVKTCDSKAVQNFLEWFSETSMFHEFTQVRLKNPNVHGLFEQRVMEQLEQGQAQGSGGTPISFKNTKLFRPFGSWLKEAFVK